MGYIKKISDDKWTLVAEAGKDPATGKRKRVRRTFYGGKRAAEKELLKLEGAIMDETLQEPSGMSVKAYLNWWLEQHSAAAKLAAKTVQSYREIIDLYLIPSLGALPLEQLHSMHIQSYVTDMNKRGLSPRTVTYSMVVLRLALKHAVNRWKLIKESPAEYIETPGNGEPRQCALSAEKMFNFLDYCYKHAGRDYPLFYAAFYTGMRRGELLGLHWNDVDMKNANCKVKWTMSRIKKEGIVFKPAPKTRAGFRTVELPSTVVTLLQKIRREQNEIKIFMGEDYYQERDLVFCQENGRPLDPDGASRRFHALAVNFGVPELRFHDTRHTHATLMLNAEVDLRVVQKRLGHQKPSTTLDIYGDHIERQLQREAADKFEQHNEPKNQSGSNGHTMGTF